MINKGGTFLIKQQWYFIPLPHFTKVHNLAIHFAFSFVASSSSQALTLLPPSSTLQKNNNKDKNTTFKKITTASFISLVHMEFIVADFSLWTSIFKKYYYNQLATVEDVPIHYVYPQWNKNAAAPFPKNGSLIHRVCHRKSAGLLASTVFSFLKNCSFLVYLFPRNQNASSTVWYRFTQNSLVNKFFSIN